MKLYIWQSTYRCQLERGLLLANNTHLKSRPQHGTSYLLNADHACEQSTCGNTATARFTPQAGKGSRGSLWPDGTQRARGPRGLLYQSALKMSFAVSNQVFLFFFLFLFKQQHYLLRSHFLTLFVQVRTSKIILVSQKIENLGLPLELLLGIPKFLFLFWLWFHKPEGKLWVCK